MDWINITDIKFKIKMDGTQTAIDSRNNELFSLPGDFNMAHLKYLIKLMNSSYKNGYEEGKKLVENNPLSEQKSDRINKLLPNGKRRKLKLRKRLLG